MIKLTLKKIVGISINGTWYESPEKLPRSKVYICGDGLKNHGLVFPNTATDYPEEVCLSLSFKNPKRAGFKKLELFFRLEDGVCFIRSSSYPYWSSLTQYTYQWLKKNVVPIVGGATQFFIWVKAEGVKP